MIVLFVEDDLDLAQRTICFLEKESIDIDYASTVKQAKSLSLSCEYDAIILDMNLPDGTGLELANFFEQKQLNTPIIFLTGQGDISHKMAAFNAGALDYLTKPFNVAELAIRLKILSQKKSINSDIYTICDLSINFSQKIIKRKERAITLSPQQWKLLTLLCQHSPNVVSKQKIITLIWPDSDANNNMYKSLISRLRLNLSRDNETPLISIVNKQGVALRET